MSNTAPSLPCWYELEVPDLDQAASFYASALGWQVAGAGMPGFDYRIASTSEGNGVAGMMSTADQQGGPPPNWVFYLEVAECDQIAERVTDLGGQVLKAPADIPGTGRFAVLADPQSAAFGILQPLPMETPPNTRAFELDRQGHGNWQELATTDPEAALAFYAELFGWTQGEGMEMGTGGTYQFIHAGEPMIGGVMGLMGSPHPV